MNNLKSENLGYLDAYVKSNEGIEIIRSPPLPKGRIAELNEIESIIASTRNDIKADKKRVPMS